MYPAIVYPLDYGYLKGVSSGDGNELDIWQGSITNRHLVAVICTVDTMKNDAEVKLIIGCTDEEIEIISEFHNSSRYMSGMVVRRSSL